MTVLGDLARPGYDAATQYISELGELGAPHGQLVSLGGFLPIGVLVLLFAWLAAPVLAPTRGAKAGLALFALVGCAYVVAAFARCDPGCPVEGATTRQTLHNTFGVLEYLGGSGGLLVLAVSFRRRPDWRSFFWPTLLASGLVQASLLGAADPSDGIGRGLAQRAGDGALFLWLAAAGWRLRPPRRLQLP